MYYNDKYHTEPCPSCRQRREWENGYPVTGERAAQLGVDAGAHVCNGCADAADIMRPTMSPETRRAIIEHFHGFPERVSRANAKAESAVKRTLHKPAKEGEALSPRFRFIAKPDVPADKRVQ